MQPIKFKPMLKQTIWGGGKIAEFKHINDNTDNNIGESWEISDVKGSESVAENGPHKGKTIHEIAAEMKEELVGADNYKRFGNDFPCGLKHEISPEKYKQMVADGTICDAIASFPVKEGDCFFIPSGRIHSICQGCFLAEIQQTSDTTYRIYDYNRRDKDGNLRELHTQEAAECIDYTVQKDYRTHYVPEKNQGVQLVNCKHFSTAVYDLDEPMTLDYSELDSFVIIIGLKGEGTFTDNEGNTTTLSEGETMLVPASTSTINVSGTIKFLETYI